MITGPQMLMARAKEEHRRSNPYDEWKRIVHVEPCPAPQQASAVPLPGTKLWLKFREI